MVWELGLVAPARWLFESVSKHLGWWKRKGLFKSLVVEHNGEKLHLTWDGPLNGVELLAVPRTLDEALKTAIEERFASEFPSGEVKVTLDFEESPKNVMVFETDKKFKWKKKVRGPTGIDHKYHLKAYVR